MTLPALAKINLNLRVRGKREDGYHELDTVFQTVSLHDTIRLSAIASSDIAFSCDDRSLPTDSHNLVVRAATALRDRVNPKKGARIRLEKRIPTHAGLGGGSSDAAATLIGLTRLWELGLTRQELSELAARLGADVPFFLHGGTARGTGIGDRLELLEDTPETFLIIVKPNANVSTADAYKALEKPALTSPNSETILSRSEAKELFDNQHFASLENDFEAAALAAAPEIERAKAALMKAGAQASLLAGSGSAVFGIFDSEDAQRRAIQAIELETGWRVFPCKTVGREQYQAALYSMSEACA
ncbi:MAG TPA: 4-(cytidine 5'-diphospho)-2-C-methyl-D-erythritol kinase [Pyrinomonadaceae bacterium]|nr:4-(cytidine 5'-diphospho)-2-C-methyl-D-erythritol kinase [Pyrinomonadaceae bacterium]